MLHKTPLSLRCAAAMGALLFLLAGMPALALGGGGEADGPPQPASTETGVVIESEDSEVPAFSDSSLAMQETSSGESTGSTASEGDSTSLPEDSTTPQQEEETTSGETADEPVEWEDEEGLLDGPIVPMSDLSGSAAVSTIFPDPVFAAYVAGQMGVTVDTVVTQTQLNSVERINGVGQTLHNLEGIQYLNNLIEVRIDNKQLTGRFPQGFLDDIYPRLDQNSYYANNQNYTNPTIYLEDPTLQQVIGQIPPLLLQIAENSGGAVIGEWVIRNQFSAVVDTIPAVDGTELEQFRFVTGGTYNVELLLGSNVWMGLDNSQYFFPVVFRDEFGSISGRVTNSAGQPLAGVTITLSNGATTTTNAQGQYSFPSVLANSYTVTASLSGYNSQTKNATVVQDQNTVVNFTLLGGVGSVTGVVTDSLSGLAIPGATVTLLSYPNFTTVAQTTSGAGGSFAFSRVPEGAYEVRASKAGYNPNNSTAFPVGADETTETAVFLTPQPVPLSGTVTDATTGLPIVGATVVINGVSLTTNGSGQYSTTVFPGAVVGTASANNYGSQRKTTTTTVGSNGVLNFELTPDPGTLRVEVVDDEGNPLPNVEITLSDGHTLTTDGNGIATIFLPPGSYDVTGALEGYESATSAGNVVASNQTTDVQLVLRRLVGNLQGYVLREGDNFPLSGATVTLSTGEVETTDGAGFYSFSGYDLPSGPLTATARLAGYGSQAAEVVIPIGGTEDHDFYLTANPADLLVRVVYAESGSAVVGALVELDDGHSETTDGSGEVAFQLDIGTYVITVSVEGYFTQTRTVTLDAGDSLTEVFEIVLEPSHLYGGVIDFETRLPIPGATVQLISMDDTTYTNQDGLYDFGELPPGMYLEVVSAPGYQAVRRYITLPPGADTVANFGLVRGVGSIIGRVTDANGNPVANATIIIGEFTVATDANGQYALMLDAGQYTAVMQYPGYPSQQKSGTVATGNTTVIDFVLPADESSLPQTTTPDSGTDSTPSGDSSPDSGGTGGGGGSAGSDSAGRNGVRTGDDSPMPFYFLLLAAAAVVCAVLLRLKLRRAKE